MEPEKQRSEDNRTERPEFRVLPLVYEVGFTIAVPLVGLALLGRYADKALGTSPILLLVGTLAAIFISTFLVYKKIIKYLK